MSEYSEMFDHYLHGFIYIFEDEGKYQWFVKNDDINNAYPEFICIDDTNNKYSTEERAMKRAVHFMRNSKKYTDYARYLANEYIKYNAA